MADEDQEVIFEGQPLDQYLKEIGFRNYEYATRVNQKRSRTTTEKCSISARIVSLWHKMNARKYITSNWWEINRLDSTKIRKVIDVILQSRLLYEEDFQLISSLDVNEENQHTLSWCVLPLGGFLGAVAWALKSPLVTVCIPALLLYTVARWAVERYHNRCLQSVVGLVESLQKLQDTSKKALRHLQETELIAQGFMFSVTGSSVERLENSSLPILTRRWRTLPGLRKGLLSTLTAAVDNLTKATQRLADNHPLRGQLDKQQFYLAFQETAILTGVNAVNYGDSGTSQEVKIEVLKVLQSCYLLLQSEFLSHLVLTLHPELRAEAACINPNIVSELLKNISVCTKELDTQYKIFSTYGMPRRVPSSESIGSASTKKLKYDALFVSVHSTTLHLQNILYQTHAVEEYLKTRENCDVLGSDMLTKDLQTAFNVILKELGMCKSCCEQGISYLNSLANPEPSKNLEEDEVRPARSLRGNEKVKQIHVGKTDLDPPVEDEVFETISTAEYFDDNVDLSDIIECSKTEKQQQKNCSKLMLDELKSVLVDKAKEWKEREEKALKNRIAKEGICETENVVKDTELALKTGFPDNQSGSSEENVADVSVHNLMFEEYHQANSRLYSGEKSCVTNIEVDNGYNGTEDERSDSKIEYSENSHLQDICVSKIRLPAPFRLHAASLSRKLMLKDYDIFYGTGENSCSEDSGNE